MTMVTERFEEACQLHDIKIAVFTPAEESGHDSYPGLTDPSELDRPRP